MLKRTIQNNFTLLNIDKVRLDKKWNYKNVISPFHRIYYIDDGVGNISTINGNCKLEAGYLYLVPSFTLCNLVCKDFLSQYFIHFFEDSGNGISLFQNNRKIFKLKATVNDVLIQKRLLTINPNRKINRSDNPDVYEKAIHYKEYEALNNRQSAGDFFETQGLMLQIISRFLGLRETKQADHSGVPSRVIELLGHIQLNLGHKVTVAELAAIVNLHPDYLSRLFIKLTGERPLIYIQRQRIERAQYLITTTDLSFAKIAELTGFATVPYFSKIFKRHTNLTPGRYREQMNRPA